MVQRMLTALIAFGPDVVRLYVEAYNFASRSLGVTRFGPFDLIATLIAAEWVVGVTAAALGLSIARRAAGMPAGAPLPGGAIGVASGAPIVAEGSWSIGRLGLVSAGLLAGMAVLSFAPLWIGALYVAACAAFVLKTYPRASARVRRLSLWIELAGVMLLAGLLLGGVRHGAAGIAEGLHAGLAMVLRAVLVLFGFTAVSVELRNPVILSWVERRRMRGLSDALGIAFGALPAFTAAFARPDATWRRPVAMAATLVAQANALAESQSGTGRRRSYILSGDTGSGKTTRAAEVVEQLRARGLRVGGILAPGLLENGRRTGFDVLNLASGESATLARDSAGGSASHAQWSRFAFSPEGLALGNRALGPDAGGADVVLVDEVGPFELAGGGWAPALDGLVGKREGPVLVVVRASIVDAVKRRWGSADTVVWDAAATSADEIVEVITKAQEHPSP